MKKYLRLLKCFLPSRTPWILITALLSVHHRKTKWRIHKYIHTLGVGFGGISLPLYPPWFSIVLSWLFSDSIVWSLATNCLCNLATSASNWFFKMLNTLFYLFSSLFIYGNISVIYKHVYIYMYMEKLTKVKNVPYIREFSNR